MGGNSRQEYLAAILERYHQSTREEKGLILQEFCAVCGYHRKHAIRLLNRRQKRPRRRPGRRPIYYSPELLTALKRIWLTTPPGSDVLKEAGGGYTALAAIL